MVRSRLAGAAALALLALAFLRPGASAIAEEDCATVDTEYDVRASIYVRDTPFGAANGEYAMGSGRMTLRVERRDGRKSVKLMSYELNNRLTVQAKVAMVTTTVVTTSKTSTARDVCDGSARGTLDGATLTWDTSVAGYRSDGTIECSGSMCGSFGAPPRGTSPFHDAPATLRFLPFTFSADGSTFTMPYTFASKSESPRQTTYLALAGRRAKAYCTATRASCARSLASLE